MHDQFAAWATTELASEYKNNLDKCFASPPLVNSVSITAGREGGRKWPISDGVVAFEVDQKGFNKSYNIAVEMKREAEGLHGILTAIGQSLAYLDKGYSASAIVIPSSYSSHDNPGEHAASIIEKHAPNAPIGVYTYSNPDLSKTSPFSGIIECHRKLQIDPQLKPLSSVNTPKIVTQWGHVREGSSDADAFFKYLQVSNKLSFASPSDPTVNLPPEMLKACKELNSSIDPLKYLSNAPSDSFHDYVWRNFWFDFILTEKVLPMYSTINSGEYHCNSQEIDILLDKDTYKKFFAGRSDSIKDTLCEKLNSRRISLDEAWIEYAKNIRKRAHSLREDIDSGLFSLGLLDDDGKPTSLGSRFITACEKGDGPYDSKPSRILGAALIQNANFSLLLHYIYRLTESALSDDPLRFTSITENYKIKFNKDEYLEWIEGELANTLGVLRKVSLRSGGKKRKPLTAELAFLEKMGFLRNKRYRVGVGLLIDWPAVESAQEFKI